MKLPIPQITLPLFLLMMISISIQSSAYTPENGVETGDVIDVEYEGRFSDADGGKIFDAGRIKEANVDPGQFIEGFYKGLLGMKVGDNKVVTIPPEEGYTNPNDPNTAQFYGKTLIFTLHLWGIVSDVSDDNGDSSSSGGAFDTILTIGKWIGIIGIFGFVAYGLNGYIGNKVSGVCVHCNSLGRSTAAEGTCSKCGNHYCRKSFSKGCPNCHANSFVPFN